MNETKVPRLSRWPFLIGDLLLLGVAGTILYYSGSPIAPLNAAICVLAVLAGAGLAIIPFTKEHTASVKLAESESLATTVDQIKELSALANQIQESTGKWQDIEDQANRCVNTAQEMSERMSKEAKDFQEFMTKLNDQEKAHLKLEVDKWRRTESEWIQVLTTILDHVYAFNRAAMRSGQPQLIDKAGNFQRACRDTARRVGLVPFVPQTGDLFDASSHQTNDHDEDSGEVPGGTRITEVTGVGYTYQGKLLRRALVKIDGAEGTEQAASAAPEESEAGRHEGQYQSTQESSTAAG